MQEINNYLIKSSRKLWKQFDSGRDLAQDTIQDFVRTLVQGARSWIAIVMLHDEAESHASINPHSQAGAERAASINWILESVLPVTYTHWKILKLGILLSWQGIKQVKGDVTSACPERRRNQHPSKQLITLSGSRDAPVQVWITIVLSVQVWRT